MQSNIQSQANVTIQSLADCYAMWDGFGNVPVSEGDDESEADAIEVAFLHFPAGTPRETVWRWFETLHPDFIVGEVMQGLRRKSPVQVPDAAAEREYLFDITLMASLRVKANNRKAAEAMVMQVFDAASCNAGVWGDGSPVLFEASVDGDIDLVEVDGEPVN